MYKHFRFYDLFPWIWSIIIAFSAWINHTYEQIFNLVDIKYFKSKTITNTENDVLIRENCENVQLMFTNVAFTYSTSWLRNTHISYEKF